MAEQDGHIELHRTVDSIVIGNRHRENLGDIDALARSIERLGLLQPVTITPDGFLVCGRRRLEAVKRLGWCTLKVWVRSGISDELSRLLAERDENEQRKDLDEVEQARLYEEISLLLAEDAARRQAATRFGSLADPAVVAIRHHRTSKSRRPVTRLPGSSQAVPPTTATSRSTRSSASRTTTPHHQRLARPRKGSWRPSRPGPRSTAPTSGSRRPWTSQASPPLARRRGQSWNGSPRMH